MSTTNTTTVENASNQAAIIFHQAVAAVCVADVRRDNRLERSVPRKELAAAARKLFKSLGLKGISVTAPNYSMAQAVHVRLPKRDDYTFDANGDIPDNDPARVGNTEADRKIAAILYQAFPSHRDRSDTQSDYFNYKWSIE